MHSARNPFTLDVFGLPADPLTALDMVLSAALTAGGVGHILLTPIFCADESALNQVWFAGSGLGLAFLGLLNIARVRGDANARGFCKVANPAGTVFFGVAVNQTRSAQTVAGLILSTALSALSLRA
ncbi:MAG: hypothetical protein WCF99_17440 [Chloroflexales bacterium]